MESENTDSWTWFLTYLKLAIPESIGMTLISGRDKGLLAAECYGSGKKTYLEILGKPSPD